MARVIIYIEVSCVRLKTKFAEIKISKALLLAWSRFWSHSRNKLVSPSRLVKILTGEFLQKTYGASRNLFADSRVLANN